MSNRWENLNREREKAPSVVPLGAGDPVPDRDTWRLVGRLMATLDVETLVQAFFEETCQKFDYHGVGYRTPDDDLEVEVGDPAAHQLVYTLRAVEASLGEIVFRSHRPFGADALAGIEERLGLLVAPLRNALEYRRALCQARVDPLTGALNRRTLEATLRREVKLAQRYGEEFSVMVMDLDRFKTVNDTHGHSVGDAVLQHCAQRLERVVRDSDLVFRVGGDEFIIAMSHTSCNGARLLGERVRRALRRHPFEEEGLTLRLDASIGVAQARDGDTADTLFERADAALYAAKEAGRDRVAVEGDS